MDRGLFQQRLAALQDEMEAFLTAHFDAAGREADRSPRLDAAMRYACLNGGKRLRPFLVVESAALFDVPRKAALHAGAALEFIHCYSLVHDDLPSMDNDDLRRGKPTVHRAFDEATAILAGDALLTDAFTLLANRAAIPSARARADLVLALALAAGGAGMVAGQIHDLAAEGRFTTEALSGAAPVPLRLAEPEIRRLQRLKTGALLQFACEAGWRLAGRSRKAERDALARYGAAFGLAFQIKDDLLDVEGSASAVGKATGKDAAAGKATIVGLLGLEEARARLAAVTDEACAALSVFGGKAAVLDALVRHNAKRNT
jgi:farnesyl diphosphate synthase